MKKSPVPILCRFLLGGLVIWILSLALEAEAQQRRKPWGRSPFQFMEKGEAETQPVPVAPLPEEIVETEEFEYDPLADEGFLDEESPAFFVEEKKFEPVISVIVISGDVRAAVINGRQYIPGDELEEHEVVDIQKNYVLFRKGEELKKFELN